MLEQFHFIRPVWLLALLPLALVLFLLFRSRSGQSPWYRLIDPALQSLLLDGSAQKRPMWFYWLLGCGWLVSVLALANPSWSELPTPMLQSTASRVIVLDLSRSMYATDIKPSRIEQARFKVTDIINHDSEGQTGLVVFAGDAFTVTPLTRDMETVTTLLMSVSPDIMPVQGSRLELGLKLAGDVLNQAGIRNGEIIAVTDGYRGRFAVNEAKRLQADGHQVSILGVGTAEGAPIADRNGTYLRNDSGNVVIAKLDRAQLTAVAEAGGGHYQSLRTDDADIRILLGDTSNTQSEGAVDEGLTSSVWDERGPWLVLLLLPIAAFAFRRGWLLLVVVLLGTTLEAPPAYAGWWEDLWWRRDQQADQAYRRGDYEAAREISQNPVLKGSSDYRRGDYETAAKTFAGDDSADAAYNLGNSLANLGRLEDAVGAYDEALRLEPGMEDAIANREAVLKALEEQQQQSGDGEGEGEDQSESDSDGNSSGESSGESGENSESQEQQGDQQDGEGEQADGEESDQQRNDGEQSEQDSFADANEQLDQEGELGDEGEDQDSPQSELGESGLDDAVEQADANAQDQAGEETQGAEMEAEELSSEEQLAAEQWLRRIPDDPGGLLRRKFRYQYRRKPAPPTNDRQTW